MGNILHPNTGQKIQYIVSSHVYVKVYDYGKRFLLTHLQVYNSGIYEDRWVWVSLREGEPTNIKEFGHPTFEDAINKAVNNPYTTIYEFESFTDMMCNWKNINYIDTITTKYKSK